MNPNLYKAAVSGNLSYFDDLEEAPDFAKQLTPNEDTALHVATEFNQTEFAKRLVQVCRPLLLQANSSGDTALHIAAGDGTKKLIELFINCTQSSDIETGEYKDLSRMTNWKKDTALHCAARRGRYECVKLLVKADPEVCRFVNNDGESPLYILFAGRNFMIKYVGDFALWSLASHQGPKGLNVLHRLVQFRHTGLVEIDVLDMLVKWRKEMIREGDDLGMTPLHYAALYGQVDAATLFLENDGDAIYVLNNDGECALHFAAYYGSIKIFNHLLVVRPDCYRMVDKKGRTALHAAVLGEQNKMVEFILNTPSLQWLINKADNDGNTPLHLAVSSRNMNILKIMSDSKKVIFNVLNNQILTGSFVAWNSDAVSWKDIYVAIYCLRRLEGNHLRLFHELIVKQRQKKIEKSIKTKDTEKMKPTNNYEKNLPSERKREVEVSLMVAVLVATVTFAAGFTLPGGFVSSGEDEGLANFTNKPAFMAFVVFNSLAFYYSIFVVCFHFIDPTWNGKHTPLGYIATIKHSTVYATLFMMLAFCCGSYVMLTKSTGLAEFAIIISAIFMSILYLHGLMGPALVFNTLLVLGIQSLIDYAIRRMRKDTSKSYSQVLLFNIYSSLYCSIA